MGPPRQISPTNEKRVCLAYQEGVKLRVIRDKFKISGGLIWAILKRNHIKQDRHEIYSEEAKRVKQLRKKLQQYKSPNITLAPNPISYRRKSDSYAFDSPTRNAAYWIGFLMADGSIQDTPHKCVVLGLALSDIEHIKKFRSFMGANNDITITKPGRWKTRSARLVIYSQRLVYVLIKYGLVPRKTWSAKVSYLEMNPDFWRGVVDGDGCLRHTPTTSVLKLVGHRDLMEQFRSFCYQICEVQIPSLFPHHTTPEIACIDLAGKKAALVIYALYGFGGPSLTRKQKIANEIMAKYSQLKGPQ